MSDYLDHRARVILQSLGLASSHFEELRTILATLNFSSKSHYVAYAFVRDVPERPIEICMGDGDPLFIRPLSLPHALRLSVALSDAVARRLPPEDTSHG